MDDLAATNRNVNMPRLPTRENLEHVTRQMLAESHAPRHERQPMGQLVLLRVLPVAAFRFQKLVPNSRSGSHDDAHAIQPDRRVAATVREWHPDEGHDRRHESFARIHHPSGGSMIS